mmetsp:Transcript_6063/g.7915  ORF Transcript_6063/g.7915 Transcript_6063/m.7915 type:complete len:322 (+) Transcript_6063:98-1063(+)
MAGTMALSTTESRLEAVIKAPHRQKFRKWSVYKLKNLQSTESRTYFPDEMEVLLSRELDVYFKHNTKVVLHKDSVWIEVGISGGYTNDGHNKFYLVHHPHSPYVFVSKKVKNQTSFILHSLCTVLGVTEGVEELKMKGRDLVSLTNLALNQLSLGAFSAYRECTEAFDSNPLRLKEAITKRRRLQAATKDEQNREQENVQFQIADDKTNTVGQVQRQSELSKPKRSFGDKIQGSGASFMTGVGLLLPPNEEEGVFSYVQFMGHNVMNGFDALYKNGLVEDKEDLPEDLHANSIMRGILSTDSDESARKMMSRKITPLYVVT